MAHRIVTFKEDGIDKISDFSNDMKSNEEIKIMLHKHSYRRNLIKKLRNETNNKNLEEMSEASLGYALELLCNSKICSTISHIEFHNLPLSNFFVVKYK